MATARCDDHKPLDSDHVSYALPLGYPSTAVTCDIVGCAMPARLWLDKDERQAFLAGERIFPSRAAPRSGSRTTSSRTEPYSRRSSPSPTKLAMRPARYPRVREAGS